MNHCTEDLASIDALLNFSVRHDDELIETCDGRSYRVISPDSLERLNQLQRPVWKLTQSKGFTYFDRIEARGNKSWTGRPYELVGVLNCPTTWLCTDCPVTHVGGPQEESTYARVFPQDDEPVFARWVEGLHLLREIAEVDEDPAVGVPPPKTPFEVPALNTSRGWTSRQYLKAAGVTGLEDDATPKKGAKDYRDEHGRVRIDRKERVIRWNGKHPWYWEKKLTPDDLSKLKRYRS